MKPFIILALLLIFQKNGTSQDTWVNYTTSDGLYSNWIQSIDGDYLNNIWIGTGGGSQGYGIDKFDGTNWIHYDTSNSGISSNAIKVIKNDMNGNLWVCFFGGSISSVLNLTKFDGTNWTYYDTSNSNILANFITDIQIYNNDIWVSSLEGLSKFDGTSFTNYPLAIQIYNFVIEDSSSIWLAYRSKYGNGLGHYNPITNYIDTLNQSNSNLPSYSMSSIDIDSQGDIWIGFDFAFNGGVGNGGSNGGIAMYNGVEFIPMMPFSTNYGLVNDLVVDNEDNVWVSTSCQGLYKFDGQNWKQVEGPPINGCFSDVTIDKLGNLWSGDQLSGLWTNKSIVSANDKIKNKDFQVSPNPVDDYFYFTNSLQQNVMFFLYDSFGNSVLTKKIESQASNIPISTNYLESGIYYWKVYSNNASFKSGQMIIIKK